MHTDNSNQIAQLIKKLKNFDVQLIDISSKIMNGGNSAVYKKDLYFLSIINRTLSLNSAFLLLLENDNSLTAITIVRLQLDNVMRLNATKVVENLDHFLDYFFEEKQINQYINNGRKLSDTLLVTELDKENPGCLSLYYYLCNFAHFSYRHFDATKQDSKNENALFSVVVGDFDIVNDTQNITLHENMCSISLIILKLSKEWYETKITY